MYYNPSRQGYLDSGCHIRKFREQHTMPKSDQCTQQLAASSSALQLPRGYNTSPCGGLTHNAQVRAGLCLPPCSRLVVSPEMPPQRFHFPFPRKYVLREQRPCLAARRAPLAETRTHLGVTEPTLARTKSKLPLRSSPANLRASQTSRARSERPCQRGALHVDFPGGAGYLPSCEPSTGAKAVRSLLSNSCTLCCARRAGRTKLLPLQISQGRKGVSYAKSSFQASDKMWVCTC